MSLSFSKSSIAFPLGDLLEVEMHSHLVPGIDDGSPDLATSVRLIKGLVELGYKKIITTPHIKADLYPNTLESIRGPFQVLQSELAEKGIDVVMDFAAEYMTDPDFNALVAGDKLLTIGGGYLLMETGFSACPANFEADLFDVQQKGWLPVLAHPERYRYIETLADYDFFKERSMLFQVNILSFTGYYGEKPKELAVGLLEAGLIDLLGTDLHNERQLAALKSFDISEPVRKLLEKSVFMNKELTGKHLTPNK